MKSLEELVEWLRGLGVLKIFWAKPVENIDILQRSPLILQVTWRTRRATDMALLTFTEQPYSTGALHRAARETGIPTKIVFTTRELGLGEYDRWSKVYIYDTEARALKPNEEVEVKVHQPGSPEAVKAAEEVQRSSWGFYIPPPPSDTVLIATQGGEPVGSAYYNPLSSNVDYGIHVKKRYWRKRIGTRLLQETLSHALACGKKWVSVVRVLRSRVPVASDRRAIAFYRANKPILELNVYRLTKQLL